MDRVYIVHWQQGDRAGTWAVKAPSEENARGEFYMMPMFKNGYIIIKVRQE